EEAQQEFLLQATYGMDAALIDAIRHQHVGLGEHAIGQAARSRAPVQVADLHEDPQQPVQNLLVQAGYRALLVVPLLSPDGLYGEMPEKAKGVLERVQANCRHLLASSTMCSTSRRSRRGSYRSPSRTIPWRRW